MNFYDEHYAKMTIQPIELMQAVLTPEEFRGFLKGNVIKYRLRAGEKEGEPANKDLAKMQRYYEWLEEAQLGIKINPREQ